MKRLRFRRTILLFAIAAGLLWGGPSMAGLTAQPARDPVWGTKPVLEYFLLSASLSEALKAEVGLTDVEFQALQEVARDEAAQLRRFEQASQRILGNPQLSLQDKRTQITQSGYNRQVEGLLLNSQNELERILDAGTYSRLVEWIEARWVVERQLHGTQAAAAAAAPARSYQVYATRYDSGGAYTVALPDKCLKLANGGSLACDGYAFGQDYAVRLQYGDNSAVKVTVLESGPWNVDDNFWATVGDPQPRRLFTDLPLGMSEAQAAYFDNYNGGLDQFGRQVTSPVAIDLAREVSIDIGLEPGVNDWITVTFLWTEGWEDQEVQEVTLEEPSQLQPAYSGDMCGSAWHQINGFSGSPAYLTLNVDSDALSTNSAEWKPDLPVDGDYKVEAFIPDHAPIDWECPVLEIPRDTSDARYTIQHAEGTAQVSGDQRPLANQWLDLGTYPFKAGTGASVKLADLNGEERYTRTVSFSAMRFILQSSPPPTQAPTPVPSPTPTPPPADPTVWSGSLSANPDSLVAVSLQGANLPEPGLGEALLEVRYDPSVASPQDCQADPGGAFDTRECNLGYESDGVAPDSLTLQLASTGGVAGEASLGDLVFEMVGDPGSYTYLEILPVTFDDSGGVKISPQLHDGLICIAPCQNISFIPLLGKLFDLIP